MFYLIKAPWILQKFYGDCVWKIKTDEPVLYLTFDDGPHPKATPFVLDQLRKYGAKATFFCIGANVAKYPEVFQQIIQEGHSIGNHTYDHLNGWKTNDELYFRNVEKAQQVINSDLFRPPFGRITKFQQKIISGLRLKLKTIMWHVLSADFDDSLNADQCYLNVVNNAEKGSIVVFHDSQKAFSNMSGSLPRILSYYSEKGYTFQRLI